jgi:hypothetical protein
MSRVFTFEEYDEFLKMGKREGLKYDRTIYEMVFAESDIIKIIKNLHNTDILEDQDKRIYQNNIGNYLPKDHSDKKSHTYENGKRNMISSMSDDGKNKLQKCLNALKLNYKMKKELFDGMKNTQSDRLKTMDQIVNTLEFTVFKIHFLIMFNHIFPRWKQNNGTMNTHRNTYIDHVKALGIGQNLNNNSSYDEFINLVHSYEIGEKKCNDVIKLIKFMEELVAMKEYKQ